MPGILLFNFRHIVDSFDYNSLYMAYNSPNIACALYIVTFFCRYGNPSMKDSLLARCLPSNKDQAAYSTTLAIPQTSPAITSVLRMPAQQSGRKPRNNMFSGVGRLQ